MAYSTGNYADVNDALDKLAAFAVAQGWTQNMNTLEGGTNRRVHLQKTINGTVCCFNFKVMLNQNGFTSYNNVYGIQVYGSTGYDAGEAWNNQPGFSTTAYGGTDVTGGCVDNMKSTGGKYHLFAHGSVLHCMFETESYYNDWRMLTIGAVNGYIYFAASGGSVEYDEDGACWRSMYRSVEGAWNSYAKYIPNSGIFDGTGWRIGSGRVSSAYKLCNAVRNGFSDDSKYSLANALITYSPDSFRGNAILAPDHVMTTGDDASKAEPFGEVEGIKYVNMTNYSNEEEITVGSNTFMLFYQQNKPGAYPVGVALLK